MTTDVTCPCRSLHYCSTSPVALKEKDTELLISERKLCLRDEYDICDQAERQQEEETELMTLCFSFCNHWWEITYRKKNPQFINDTISKVIQLKLNLMHSKLKKIFISMS